jgi:aspartate/methionine/tyrosine aminotransferase
VALLSEAGILAAPGDFYGPTGASHVRIALTATDERVAAAARRLSGL